MVQKHRKYWHYKKPPYCIIKGNKIFPPEGTDHFNEESLNRALKKLQSIRDSSQSRKDMNMVRRRKKHLVNLF